jgi:excinuclease ABC subunit C
VTRNQLERGGTVTPVTRCFGPYANRRFRDVLLGFVSGHFQLRTCAPLPAKISLHYDLEARGGVCGAEYRAQRMPEPRPKRSGVLSRSQADLIPQMKRRMLECILLERHLLNRGVLGS